jgi:hypothetical protein
MSVSALRVNGSVASQLPKKPYGNITLPPVGGIHLPPDGDFPRSLKNDPEKHEIYTASHSATRIQQFHLAVSVIGNAATESFVLQSNESLVLPRF